MPEKTADEVWMRRASTVSRGCRKFHTKKNCPKLRKGEGSGADDIIVVSDPDNSECRFCDGSVEYPGENARQQSLAVKLRGSDNPRQVLERV